MPGGEDLLSAMRSDMVRELRRYADIPESVAVDMAAKVIEAMKHRYQGEQLYVCGKPRPDPAVVLQAYDGRNHKAVCRQFGISRRTLQRYKKRYAEEA